MNSKGEEFEASSFLSALGGKQGTHEKGEKKGRAGEESKKVRILVYCRERLEAIE